MSGLGAERVWAQVLIRRAGAGFELRHQQDRAADASGLRPVAVAALRRLAEVDGAGGFRPHHTAPSLVSGWVCAVADAHGLKEALDQLYPGTMDDWAALVLGTARPTDFASVAARQMGRAKGLQTLRGRPLLATISAACSAASCLKHRRWNAADVPMDDGFGKSGIPCLEPCPLFLGFARSCAGADATPIVETAFTPQELGTLAAALRHALEHPPAGIRTGDWSAPLHARRLTRMLELHAELWSRASEPAGEEQ
ncbi:MAG: hypothetical protein IT580_09225 [Verrucomicrobiales bacterium]|nr:hypothetical protein [Verrucomicrobiales bacterium]